MAELAGREQDQRKTDQHDDGADEGRKVGIDVLDADFREYRGQGGEYRRQHRPDLPRRQRFGVHEAGLGWGIEILILRSDLLVASRRMDVDALMVRDARRRAPHHEVTRISSGRPATPAAATPRRLHRSGSAPLPATPRHRSVDARYRRNASCGLRWESAHRHCPRSSRYDRAIP